jgi:streptogramin lyase
MAQLRAIVTIPLGQTADWVSVTSDAVWVGSTGPYAVHRIDPASNRVVATVVLPGEPCAGLATGFGSLWIPLCGRPGALARVDLETNALRAVYPVAPAGAEGGITASPDSIWLPIAKAGWLARIDPATGAIRQRVRIPQGSFNPLYSDGRIWVTRAVHAGVTVIDAQTGIVAKRVPTGPGPRFLTAGEAGVWTLNQGDGTVTRIDTATTTAGVPVRLGTPGHGGDIAAGGGLIWTTMAKVPLSAIDAATSKVLCQWTGPGGDSLGIGHGSIWLTDYHAGTIARFDLKDTIANCRESHRTPPAPEQGQ